MTIEKPKKLELVPSDDDAFDIKSLWLDPGLGDGITDQHWHEVAIGKPKDFFRVSPIKSQRRRCEIYLHKPEGVIDEVHYFIAPSMKGLVPDARPCVILPCIYRSGAPRLWPVFFSARRRTG